MKGILSVPVVFRFGKKKVKLPGVEDKKKCNFSNAAARDGKSYKHFGKEHGSFYIVIMSSNHSSSRYLFKRKQCVPMAILQKRTRKSFVFVKV